MKRIRKLYGGGYAIPSYNYIDPNTINTDFNWGNIATGALSGAAAGTSIAPIWGTVGGALLGGIGSAFMSSAEQQQALAQRNSIIDANKHNQANVDRYRQTNMDNQIGTPYSYYKKGGKINIKPSHRGLFTQYCGGKVTNDCINKGLHSNNPAVRRRANFAKNARKWTHKADGGRIDFPGVKYANPYLIPDYKQPMIGNTILPDPLRPKLYGTDATEYKMGIDVDGNEIQIPTIVNGQYLGPDNAVENFMLTGESFGNMPNPNSYSKFYDTINKLGIMKKAKGGKIKTKKEPKSFDWNKLLDVDWNRALDYIKPTAIKGTDTTRRTIPWSESVKEIPYVATRITNIVPSVYGTINKAINEERYNTDFIPMPKTSQKIIENVRDKHFVEPIINAPINNTFGPLFDGLDYLHNKWNNFYDKNISPNLANGGNIPNIVTNSKINKIGNAVEVSGKPGKDKISANIEGTPVKLDNKEIIVYYKGEPVVISDDLGEADKYRQAIANGMPQEQANIIFAERAIKLNPNPTNKKWNGGWLGYDTPKRSWLGYNTQNSIYPDTKLDYTPYYVNSRLYGMNKYNNVEPMSNRYKNVQTINNDTISIPDYTPNTNIKHVPSIFDKLSLSLNNANWSNIGTGLNLAATLGNNINSAYQLSKTKYPTLRTSPYIPININANNPLFNEQERKVNNVYDNLSSQILNNTNNSNVALNRLTSLNNARVDKLNPIFASRLADRNRLENINTTGFNENNKLNTSIVNSARIGQYQDSLNRINTTHGLIDSATSSIENVIDNINKGEYDDELLQAIAQQYGLSGDDLQNAETIKNALIKKLLANARASGLITK